MTASDTSILPQTLYKVCMPDGSPCHGGPPTFRWKLPKDKRPGAWVEHDGPIEVCSKGLHLTTAPSGWYVPGALVFDAETDDPNGQWQADKVAVRRARLLRQRDWAEFGIYTSGHHAVSGSATVRAYDSATVRAYGSATVRAYGSATVEAYDSATVRAYDSATVEAYDSATVEAYGSATVEAYDSATVEAYDSATVEAYDSATVISTRYHSVDALVELSEQAAHVDRRAAKMVLRGLNRQTLVVEPAS